MTQLLQPMQLSSLTPMRWFFGSKNKAPVGQALAHGASYAVMASHRCGDLVRTRHAQARRGDVAGNIVCLDARRHTGLASNAA